DGICSASLAIAAKKDARIVFTNPANLLSELKSIPDGNNIIIVDIALTNRHKDEIVLEFKRLCSKGEVVYLDHHPLPPRLSLRDLPVKTVDGSKGACASELTYVFFESELDLEMSRVAIYGAIGDYSDNTTCIKELLKKWDKRELYLEAGILVAALEGIKKKDFDFKRKIVKYLSENRLPSSDRNLVEIALRESERDEKMRQIVKNSVKKHGKVAYVINIGWSLGKAATYARAYADTPVGVAAEEIEENIDLSVRSIGLKNLHRIVSRVAEELGGVGGGHANAAGARIPKGLFLEFIKKLNGKL
ncbi:MAG: DHHA1 domain-containing protein, partial [Nitrososphaerota archaeon]|nr:DHHA1 domain-containing protein [Nitrososphaerota archaeon]